MEIREEGIREKMLLTLIESVLGKGRSTARNNAAFSCPFCHHSKPKLELQVRTNDKKENPWHCWSCDEKGKTVSSLFKKLKAPQHKIQELYSLIKPGTKQEIVINALSLPKEFISLSLAAQMDGMSAIEAKHAIKFLKQRGITENDVLKYNIGFCASGNFAHRVVVPS
jgi:hypothetical protein